MNLQTLVDGMSAQWMKDRAQSQMTLGEMIERLEQLPPDTLINLGNSHSYRGYYSDLAFEALDRATASEVLQECQDSMGQSFEGYKGGDYYMHAGVPIWVADYGRCGKKLIAINDDGTLETEDDF